MRPLVLAAALAVAASACSGGSGDATSASTTTVPAPTVTTMAPPPTTAPDPACARFRGTTEPLASVGERPPALLVDAEVELVGCLDRVTFTFESLGDGTPPGYDVRYRDVVAEPLLDGDAPISPPGEAFLVVTIAPASSNDPRREDRPATYLGNLRLAYDDSHHLTIVRKLPDPIGAVQWVIGLDGVRPFLVDSAEGPTRVSVYIG